jgi:hypothetical protein
MGIEITQKGNWDRTTQYLNRLKDSDLAKFLTKYGQQGVAALAAATPEDSGLTAHSWSFDVVSRKGYYSIRWYNSHVVDGRPIAILLQYGHGTGTGGYVQGRDYIMPAIRPIFDQIEAEVWREVTR